MVYEILNASDLAYYYDLENNPGISPKLVEGKYDFLEDRAIQERLLEFDEQETQVINLTIPAIHCSSCIWVLENLNKLSKGVVNTQVNFPKKTARITFRSSEINLKQVAELLSKIGYEPQISLDDFEAKQKKVDRSLIYKLGVAGFAFGNIMFLSFPEYFEVGEFWLDKFKYVFRWLMFVFSLPVVFYAGRDYFISAYKGLRNHFLNIDIPIALGIAVLFIRSFVDIAMDWGTGFFDSLAGLVFFLLVGRFFQQKTYNYLSFERDYKSYFPIAVTRTFNAKEDKPESRQVQVYDLKPGDEILLRNEEIIPADGLLISEEALIDYSFVTGEAAPVEKQKGQKVFAGGKQKGGIISIKLTHAVQQSYLTKLWENDAFKDSNKPKFKTLVDGISKRFTIAVLTLAFVTTALWFFIDASKALNVFTALLIVACPCAIALASPFTLGNLLRIFGQKKFYLKNSEILERMAQVDTIVFDKTGTLTSTRENAVRYFGESLNSQEKILLANTLHASNHPLSRSLYAHLKVKQGIHLDAFTEALGQGIAGAYEHMVLLVGSAAFAKAPLQEISFSETSVYININGEYRGKFVFETQYRDGMSQLFNALEKDYDLIILSGDNAGEKSRLEKMYPQMDAMHFYQKPHDKLEFVKRLQKYGHKVAMLGDGLNDAGALAQSDVGIAVSENVNVFSPACDAIIDASQLHNLDTFLTLSRKGISIIKYSLLFSLFYNLVGISFAVTGNLMPVVAAILMPLSSISIVAFTTLATHQVSKRNFNKVFKADKSHHFGESPKVILSQESGKS